MGRGIREGGVALVAGRNVEAGAAANLHASSSDLRDLAILDLRKLALADSITVEHQALGLAAPILVVEGQQQLLHGSLHVLHTPLHQSE